MSKSQPKSTLQKALTINLDDTKYGAIVEIGAGQEVARNFFNAGAAAGTIAKTMSAYDMQVSNHVYGKTTRYVSRERLEQMLEKEFSLLRSRLESHRSPETTFFSYAATVAARGYKKSAECHGWIGVSLQLRPGEEPSHIALHVRMKDQENEAQCQALGILGVNLIHGAYTYSHKPTVIIDSLLDNIESDRLEIDLIDFKGPAFKHIDNRLMNLQLIHSWTTRAVMFNAEGCSVVPRDMLYKKPVYLVRGSFKPPTKVHMDMSTFGAQQFAEVKGVTADNVVNVAEITMAELISSGDTVDNTDFISRMELLTQMGSTVLVSDYLRFFRLRSWLRQYTDNPIAITLSVLDFSYLFDDKYYDGLEGGIMEAMGKLFPDNTHVYVYPAKINGKLVTLDNVSVPEQHRYLLKYLTENNRLIACENYNEDHLHISARDIARKIQAGETGWESDVSEQVLEQIKSKKLFGYR